MGHRRLLQWIFQIITINLLLQVAFAATGVNPTLAELNEPECTNCTEESAIYSWDYDYGNFSWMTNFSYPDYVVDSAMDMGTRRFGSTYLATRTDRITDNHLDAERSCNYYRY
uniref:Uncharacterized protein n=1 Tax=Anopheles atroparvus TaxID=41427 RepID=A0A182JL09_ANOAO